MGPPIDRDRPGVITVDSLDALLRRAHELTRQPAPQLEIVHIAEALKNHGRWLDAASVWALARSESALAREPRLDELSIAQQAMCLSKERVDLRIDDAFARAVALLEAGGLATTMDQETLGIAGGVYKRYWDTFRQTSHLQQALTYYERGWAAAGVADDGYTGINAAYVADVLAFTEETVARRGGAPAPQPAATRREIARRIRLAIVAEAPTLERRLADRVSGLIPSGSPNHPWWILVTLAEAHFGLGPQEGAHYAQAAIYLQRAMAIRREAWMLETTARQLGAMARMQDAIDPPSGADSRPWQVLELLVAEAPGLRTEIGAKVGLALSGGGFRASLFHIGVLARLAELDLLRHVEVLSCVSGGSILGAAYYLRLRALLEAKRDAEITQADYLALVSQLETDFLRAVQDHNFRMRMLEGASVNFRMLHDRASRTEALGRVMGRTLYGSDQTRMDEIRIRPPDGHDDFRPADYNWRRRHKIPLLVLNATTLDGGHPWHFTPYEMGEPQLSAVDASLRRARRPYPLVGGAPHLWRAVTASACVPVLFEPIRVPFDDGETDLLDGGVHDNQGASALLDQDCTLLFVSDASGQLTRDASPSTAFAAVGLRADAIVQERLRIALYEALESRRRGSLLRGLMFLHLRLGLGGEGGAPTPYGISTAVQGRIAAIRTDLDVFNDVEALSLMVSGYRMARQQFAEQLPAVAGPAPAEHAWTFRGFEGHVTASPPSPKLIALLDLAGRGFFKAWRVVPALAWAGRLLLVLAAAALLWVAYVLLRSDATISVSSVTWAVLAAIGGVALERVLSLKLPSWKKEVVFVLLAFAGAGLARIHAKWLDPAYLRAGRRDVV